MCPFQLGLRYHILSQPFKTEPACLGHKAHHNYWVDGLKHIAELSKALQASHHCTSIISTLCSYNDVVLLFSIFNLQDTPQLTSRDYVKVDSSLVYWGLTGPLSSKVRLKGMDMGALILAQCHQCHLHAHKHHPLSAAEICLS